MLFASCLELMHQGKKLCRMFLQINVLYDSNIYIYIYIYIAMYISSSTNMKYASWLEYTAYLFMFLIRTRSCHRRCSIKKLFLKISQCSQENTCVGFSFQLKLKMFRSATLCVPINIVKFLRTPILKNICEQLLLQNLLWISSLLSTFVPNKGLL